jgi:phytoene dehydrogenase-like protein
MGAVILGGGLQGLICAAELVRSGVHVELRERASVLGGHARSPELGGIPLNLGPRAIYRGGVFHRALRACGIEPKGFRPGEGSYASVAGELHALPTGLTDLLRARFLDGTGKRELALALAQVTIGKHGAKPDETIGEWIDRHTTSTTARAYMQSIARISTYSATMTLPAHLVLAQIRSAATRGVIYTHGAWGPIVDELASYLVSNGAIIRKGCADQDGANILAFDDESKNPVLASCLDVVLERLPVPERKLVLGIDKPTYVSLHKRDAPFALHAMWYGTASRAELEALMDEAQPGWRDVLIEARYLSRMVVDTGAPGPNGTLLADAAAARGIEKARTFLQTARRAA